MLEGFKQIVDGVQQVLDPINPMTSAMDKHRNQEIAIGLLTSGFSVEDIQQFVDVSRAQLDPFLEIEARVMQRMAIAKKAPVKKAAPKAT